ARPDAALLSTPGLASAAANLRANRQTEMQRERQRAAAPAGAKLPPLPPVEDRIFRAEIAARFSRLAEIEGGLAERLVLFWSNHFAISSAKGNHVRVMAGAFEREAIRPFVLGRFADMLRAVETHPAMLFYLDNNQSIGPLSRNGLTSRRGLNENLGREILELHTMGVDGGYAQTDVTALARALTGWTVVWPDEDMVHGGNFAFGPARHEPGAQTVLARSYAQDDQGQALEMLDDLARHPATARHIARKLASHFVADVPPPELVDHLATVFLESDGDLGAVMRALVAAPIVWEAQLTKLRAPQEFLVAAMRVIGAVTEPGAVVEMLNNLGQPLWQPPGPNGWGDTVADWAAPQALTARLDLAAQWGRRNDAVDPVGLADAVFGPGLSRDSRDAIARAESRRQGLAILLMAPEMQRR
ncbi:MAG: DUF1800 family protein, partial [Acetobacteraceae bacterium]|nr:DUF1800 family protein [Acetobacteraceae bacterium]